MDHRPLDSDGMPLGQRSEFPTAYAPELLFPIDRSRARDAAGLSEPLPFDGVDVWNAWELSWRDERGLPHVGIARLEIPAHTPRTVESKSLKLYLHGLCDERFALPMDVAQRIQGDLDALVGGAVSVSIREPKEWSFEPWANPGACLEEIVGPDATFEPTEGPTPERLHASGPHQRDVLTTHLLRTLCPVTGQPDWASVRLEVEGPAIDREGLLAYLVSLRSHEGFHESCTETIFHDLWSRCRPVRLSVDARFTRRGGIDICPFRSSHLDTPSGGRVVRQ